MWYDADIEEILIEEYRLTAKIAELAARINEIMQGNRAYLAMLEKEIKRRETSEATNAAETKSASTALFRSTASAKWFHSST